MIKISERNFWLAQVFGWGIFAIANFFIQYFVANVVEQALINSSIIFFGGILITSIYRFFIKRANLNLMNIGKTILIIISSSILLIVAFLLVISIVIFILHEDKYLSFNEILGNSFIFGIIMLIWNSLYFMIHYLHSWKNAESEKWKLEAAVKDAQLGNLKAQINPHFMFNAINNIRALISEDGEKAKEMLLHFSDMFRYSLIHNDQSLVQLDEEIEIVEKYLELLSIQFEEKLAFTIDVDSSLEKEKIPPMMLQLLVENAIKHGISELPNGGLVEIKGQSNSNELILIVRNTGAMHSGQSMQKKLGVGLKNIRERLNLIYGNKANLKIMEEEGFVVAQLTIPKSDLK